MIAMKFRDEEHIVAFMGAVLEVIENSGGRASFPEVIRTIRALLEKGLIELIEGRDKSGALRIAFRMRLAN